MGELIVITFVAIIATGMWWSHQRTPELATRRVRFSPDLTSSQVTTLLDTVASLPRTATVRLTASATGGRTSFWLAAAECDLATLAGALAGIAPGVRLDDDEEASPPGALVRRHLSWRGQHVLLRTDDPDSTAAALLGVLSSTAAGETVQLHITARSIGVRRPMVRSAQHAASTTTETAMHKKYAGHCLRTMIEVASSTSNVHRTSTVMSRLRTVLASRRGVRGRLVTRPSGDIFDALAAFFPNTFSAILSPTELVGLLPWPIGAPNIPGVEYGIATRLLPPENASTISDGRVFGVSTWPGKKSTSLVQPTKGATCHSLLLGPTGSGKSWLLASLLLQDAEHGHGAVLLDMKGDTAVDVLSRLDRCRDDVVVLEPTAGLPVPGLRSFGDQPELAADLWLHVFRGLFPDSFGIRSQRYLRMGCRTLAASDPTATILDLPRLFQDAGYRRQLVARLDDPLLVGEWAAFEQMSEAQKSEHVMSPLGKVSEVISRRSVRAVLGQPTPKTTIATALQQGKIVVVSLPPGVLGQPAAQLLGALVIFEVWQTIMSRQSISADKRPYVGLYIDEPAVLGNLPLPLDTLFETARGMGCGITLATQSLKQLPPRVAQAALTNAATIAAFRPSRADAKMLADELPGVSADQLQLLAPYTVALRLGLSPGETTPVTTAKTLPLGPPTTNADEIRQHSARKYGIDAVTVDERLRQRLGIRPHGSPPETDAPVIGERRRAS